MDLKEVVKEIQELRAEQVSLGSRIDRYIKLNSSEYYDKDDICYLLGIGLTKANELIRDGVDLGYFTKLKRVNKVVVEKKGFHKFCEDRGIAA